MTYDAMLRFMCAFPALCPNSSYDWSLFHRTLNRFASVTIIAENIFVVSYVKGDRVLLEARWTE